LKYPERVTEGFDQYFEHDHVLKLLYMDNICPLSFPKFCKIFLKELNNFNLLKTISGLKKKPLKNMKLTFKIIFLWFMVVLYLIGVKYVFGKIFHTPNQVLVVQTSI